MKRLEIERSVLSMALQEGAGADENIFENRLYRKIVGGVNALEERGEEINALSVSQESGVDVKLILQIEDYSPTGVNRKHWEDQLRTLVRRDRIVSEVTQISRNAEKLSADEIELRIEQVLQEHYEGNVGVVSFKQALRQQVNWLEKPLPEGFKTNIHSIDSVVRMGPGKVAVIGGRPSHGKSAFALQYSAVLASSGVRVLYNSGEMDASECAGRLLANSARVAVDRIDRHDLQDSDWPKLGRAAERIRDYPLDFVPASVSGFEAFLRLARRRVKGHNTKVVVLDHIQRVHMSRKHTKSRAEEIGHMAHQLKDLARSEGVLVVIVAQLNRENEKRQDPTPIISDLKASGDLEQEADIVLLPYQPWRYKDNLPRDRIGIVVGKNRQGEIPPKPLQVGWKGKYNWFYELT